MIYYHKSVQSHILLFEDLAMNKKFLNTLPNMPLELTWAMTVHRFDEKTKCQEIHSDKEGFIHILIGKKKK